MGEVCRILGHLLAPVAPAGARAIHEQLGVRRRTTTAAPAARASTLCWRGARRAAPRCSGAAVPDLPAHRGGGGGLSRRDRPARLSGLVDSHCHLQHERFDARPRCGPRAGRGGGHRAHPGTRLGRRLVGGGARAGRAACAARAGRRRRCIPTTPPRPTSGTGVSSRRCSATRAARRSGRSASTSSATCRRRTCSAPPSSDSWAIAAERGLPVLVHDRDAHDEVTAPCSAGRGRAARRCARRAARLLRRCGHGGDTHRGAASSSASPCRSASRAAVGPRAAAAAIPAGSYLVETDAPYLGPDRDGRNEPTTVLRVAAELAELRGIEPQAVVADAAEERTSA